MRILVIEDDRSLAAALEGAFAQAGIACEMASTAGEAEEVLRGYDFDAAVLDLGLPDDDGMNVLRRLRSAGNRIPVIILTARSNPQARVDGLRAGADDYLGKPFLFAELLARLDAVLRRIDNRAGSVATCGGLSFDIAGRMAALHGRPLPLSPRERDLLEILVRRQGRPVSFSMIEDRLCGPAETISPNALEVSVHRLRRKLAGAGIVIENVRGLGYQIRAEA